MGEMLLTTNQKVYLYQYARNVQLENFEKWLNSPIYRIMPLERVLQIYENKELYFPNISRCWEDPYELFVYKQHYIYNGYNLDVNEVLQHHYGQCWSRRKDSDAMWRIYSPDMKSVRLKSTIGRVINALFLGKGNDMVLNYGIVKYYNLRGIETWLKNNFTGSFSDEYVINSYFIKRTNFSHEEEVRFIISTPTTDGTNMFPALNGIKITIQPDDVISQIALDPRLPKDRCDVLENLLLRYTGHNTKVVQSRLYQMKPLTISV